MKLKLDQTFVREVKALVGDGSREARVGMIKRVCAATKDLSTIRVRSIFNDCICKYGRAVVMVCVAASMDARKADMDDVSLNWAQAVLGLLPKIVVRGIQNRGTIDDGIHPTAICDYAWPMMRLTVDEGLEELYC